METLSEVQGALTENDLIELVENAYAGRILSEHDKLLSVQAATINEQRLLSGVLDNPRPDRERLSENAAGKVLSG